jgi:hypothetical protein
MLTRMPWLQGESEQPLNRMSVETFCAVSNNPLELTEPIQRPGSWPSWRRPPWTNCKRPIITTSNIDIDV